MSNLEAAECRVEKTGNRLHARIPGFDATLFPGMAGMSWLETFWDRVEIEVLECGRPSVRHRYGSGAQMAVHALITLSFALEFWLGATRLTWQQFGLLTVAANLLPWLVASIQVNLFLHAHVFGGAKPLKKR